MQNKQLPMTKTINGKVYRFVNSFTRKDYALQEADSYKHKFGTYPSYSTRIIIGTSKKGDKIYGVYVGPKLKK